ncbi:MAG: hypothetical protein QF408_00295 [Pirellulales bacterium]|jgi:hypothetical protein|nr:hypothetical protein [Pirellulales bacterium]HJN65962.1 hypothetical protein [Pirellulales bacterium]
MSYTLLVLLSITAPAADSKEANPQADLATAIPHALALIQADEFENFIRHYAVPKELEKILGQKTLEELVRGFAKDHAARVALLLEEIQDKQPKLSADGNIAQYPIDLKNFSRKQLVFEKIGGLWYLRN